MENIQSFWKFSFGRGWQFFIGCTLPYWHFSIFIKNINFAYDILSKSFKLNYFIITIYTKFYIFWKFQLNLPRKFQLLLPKFFSIHTSKKISTLTSKKFFNSTIQENFNSYIQKFLVFLILSGWQFNSLFLLKIIHNIISNILHSFFFISIFKYNTIIINLITYFFIKI